MAGWLFPGIYGPAITQGDMQISNMLGYQLSQAGYPAEAIGMFSINNPVIASAVEKLRYSMVSSDSLRSLIFILLAFGAVMLTVTGKIKSWMGAAAIGILVVADLYPVNKRYLNHESFCTPQVTASDPFPPQRKRPQNPCRHGNELPRDGCAKVLPGRTILPS